MPTVYTTRPSVTTSYGSRDPVGRKYLATQNGKILTTQDGKWIIAVDSTNTPYTSRPQILRGDSMPVITSGYWDDLLLWDDTKLWNDSVSLGTPYTTRPTI